MKNVFSLVAAVAVFFGLVLGASFATGQVTAKPKDSKTTSGSNNSNSSSKSANSSSKSNSSNSNNSSSSGRSGSSNSNSSSTNSVHSSSSTAHFNSPTLNSLKNSQTGQANGKGAPSASKEYDNAPPRDKQ